MKYVLLGMLLCLSNIVLTGCGDRDRQRSLDVANERIQDLNRAKILLEEENTKYRERFDDQVEAFRETYENRIAVLNEQIEDMRLSRQNDLSDIRKIYDQRIADLDAKLSDKRMELSLSERQRLALRELAEQPDRLKELRSDNFHMERLMWLLGVIISCFVSFVFAFRFFTLRKLRRDNIARMVADATNPKRNHL